MGRSTRRNLVVEHEDEQKNQIGKRWNIQLSNKFIIISRYTGHLSQTSYRYFFSSAQYFCQQREHPNTHPTFPN